MNNKNALWIIIVILILLLLSSSSFLIKPKYQTMEYFSCNELNNPKGIICVGGSTYLGKNVCFRVGRNKKKNPNGWHSDQLSQEEKLQCNSVKVGNWWCDSIADMCHAPNLKNLTRIY